MATFQSHLLPDMSRNTTDYHYDGSFLPILIMGFCLLHSFPMHNNFLGGASNITLLYIYVCVVISFIWWFNDSLTLPHGFPLPDISWKGYYGQNLPTGATMGFCLLHYLPPGFTPLPEISWKWYTARIFPLPLWVFACCIVCTRFYTTARNILKGVLWPESSHCHYGSLLVVFFATWFFTVRHILKGVLWPESSHCHCGFLLVAFFFSACLLFRRLQTSLSLYIYVCVGVNFIGWFFNYQSNWPPGFTPLLSTCMKEYHGQTLPPSCILKGALKL
jgi:hypothetical protein